VTFFSLIVRFSVDRGNRYNCNNAIFRWHKFKLRKLIKVIFGDFNPASVEHQGSAVGVATSMWRLCCGLDGPVFESRYGHSSKAFGPASYSMGTGFIPGIKRPGREVNHSSSSSVFMLRRGKALPFVCHVVYLHHILKKYVAIIMSFFNMIRASFSWKP
jgi:hypothetical protein